MLHKLSMLHLVLSLFALSCRGASGPTADSTMAKGTKGMVSTAHPIATEAGLKILRAGGNAFDAAIATALTLNVATAFYSLARKRRYEKQLPSLSSAFMASSRNSPAAGVASMKPVWKRWMPSGIICVTRHSFYFPTPYP